MTNFRPCGECGTAIVETTYGWSHIRSPYPHWARPQTEPQAPSLWGRIREHFGWTPNANSIQSDPRCDELVDLCNAGTEALR
jgi:hypothetical protein